jgi:hypothetical protein
MELPIEKDIERRRGDTKPIRFTITDSAGADQNLTGFSFRLSVNPEKAPTDNTGQSFQVVGTAPSDGNFQFVPTTVQVDIVGKYYYDVQMIDGLGHIYTTHVGKMTFIQDITKEET